VENQDTAGVGVGVGVTFFNMASDFCTTATCIDFLCGASLGVAFAFFLPQLAPTPRLCARPAPAKMQRRYARQILSVNTLDHIGMPISGHMLLARSQ
jgi:hypothetical protein